MYEPKANTYYMTARSYELADVVGLGRSAINNPQKGSKTSIFISLVFQSVFSLISLRFAYRQWRLELSVKPQR